MHQQNYLKISFPSLRKFLIVFLMITVIVPTSFISLPQKAEAIPVIVLTVVTNWMEIAGLAEWVVQTVKQIAILAEDTITAIKTTYLALKESVLDPIARLLGVELTNMLTNQMFSLIAKGNVINFNQGETASGNEAFVTNPQKYFGDVAEETTQVFLTDLKNNRPDRLQSINKAVSERITAEIYVDPKNMERSTFPGGDSGYQAYLTSPGNCSTGVIWDCYFSSLEPQNDPWSIYQFENERRASKTRTDVTLSQDEILAGDGYVTLKDCVEKDINHNCTDYLNKTPGDTLAGQVTLYLNNSLKNLQNVDEVDEVITLGMDLVRDWLNGKGLAHLSS
jgi:hypothetical protein